MANNTNEKKLEQCKKEYIEHKSKRKVSTLSSKYGISVNKMTSIMREEGWDLQREAYQKNKENKKKQIKETNDLLIATNSATRAILKALIKRVEGGEIATMEIREVKGLLQSMQELKKDLDKGGDKEVEIDRELSLMPTEVLEMIISREYDI